MPRHAVFIVSLGEQRRLESTGPFGDQSGAALVLRAADLAQATVDAHNVPAQLVGGRELTMHERRAK